jgi:hypothetical protein
VSGFSFPGLPFILIGENHHISWSFHLNNEDQEQLYIDPNMKDYPSSSFMERKENLLLFGEKENYSFPILEVSSSFAKDSYCRDVINIIDSTIQSVSYSNDFHHIFLCSNSSSHRNLLKSFWFLNQAKDSQDIEESMKKNEGYPGLNVIYSLNEQGQVGMIQNKR